MRVRSNQSRNLHGSLALQEKCLRALGNIYGSEALKGEQQLFVKGFDPAAVETRRAWRKIRNGVWRQPDAYQHIAYTYLYAIKRSHPLFPISRLPLFMYIAEAALCFSSAYDRLVKTTHLQRSERVAPWTAARLERAVAWLLLVLGGVAVWDFNSPSEAWLVKAFRISLALAVGSVVAWIVQICGYMRWRDCRHLPVWLTVKVMKRLWALAARPSTPFREADSGSPSVPRWRPVTTSAIRPRVVAAMALMLLGFSAWNVGVPAFQRVWTGWEVAANSREFVAKAEAFLQQKAASRPTVDTVERLADPKADVPHIVEVAARVDEILREAKAFLAEGQRLVEAGAGLELTETRQAMALVRKLRDVEQSLEDLHKRAMKQEQLLRHAEIVERVELIARQLAVETRQHSASRPVSLDDKRREFDGIREVVSRFVWKRELAHSSGW